MPHEASWAPQDDRRSAGFWIPTVTVIWLLCCSRLSRTSALVSRPCAGLSSCRVPQRTRRSLQSCNLRDKMQEEEPPTELQTMNSIFFPSKRRAFLQSSFVVPPILVLPTESAQAAAPVRVEEVDSYTARWERLLRKKPPKVLRPKLELDFAVLLMRSSYNALDALDCVAMDQFQRDFFLLRQAEYQYYNEQVGVGAMQQGQLTDPYYFDFISFAQYATISREMAGNPPMVFTEQQPQKPAETVQPAGEASSRVNALPDTNTSSAVVDDDVTPQTFKPVVVRRDPSLQDNSLLPVAHNDLVGEAILNKLEELFGNGPSSLPPVPPKSRPTSDVVLTSFKQLVNLFLINGFAFDGRAEQVSSKKKSTMNSMTFQMTLTAPATLWSGKALQLRRAKPANDFLLKAAKVWARRVGYTVLDASVKYTATEEVSTLTLV